MKRIAIVLLAGVFVFSFTSYIFSSENKYNSISPDAWDLSFTAPKDDPLWETVSKLWDNHFNRKNIDEIISTLHALEKKYPDKLICHLWLAQAYYLKAKYKRKSRMENYKTSEKYAVSALKIDKDNKAAWKIICATALNHEDMQYLLTKYSKISRNDTTQTIGNAIHEIKDTDQEENAAANWNQKIDIGKGGIFAQPIGRALPEIKDAEQWNKAITYWDQRIDLEKAMVSVKLFKEIAGSAPNNALAQLWVARSTYYIGYYYTSMEKHDDGVPFYKEGERYAKKALKISPANVPANYWRQLNLSRSIQETSLFTKARHVKTIKNHLVHTANENMTYFYCGPLISMATIINKGGWLAEKGMEMSGYTMEMVMNGLDMAIYAYPTYFYTYYGKAEVLAHTGRKDESKAILKKLLSMDPNCNQLHTPENHCALRLAKVLLETME